MFSFGASIRGFNYGLPFGTGKHFWVKKGKIPKKVVFSTVRRFLTCLPFFFFFFFQWCFFLSLRSNPGPTQLGVRGEVGIEEMRFTNAFLPMDCETKIDAGREILTGTKLF